MSPAEVAPQVLDLALDRRPTLGSGRLVCVDGPAGSGKTTLAAAVADLAGGRGLSSAVVHIDDLLAGWRGLPHVGEAVAALLEPLTRGERGSYRRWDWACDAFTEQVVVDPGDLLVLEGVGSGESRHREARTLLVWVTAPEDLRLRRGLARDGEEAREHWLRWLDDEAAYLARDRPDLAADMHVDGTGRTPPRRA